ncbi:MAG: NADP(+)-dependent, decarboxylating phosphogluconate dehydrogenase [Candidatus Eiseniibacteriota bacterium]
MSAELPRRVAIVGLGKMGGNLARQALEKDIEVVGVNRGGVSDELRHAGVTAARSIADLGEALAPPRIVLLYIPAGPAVDEALDALAGVLAPGDIVGDGGNSYWGDSIRRAARLAERGIAFLDIGTSGGVAGARHGACFMVGGERGAVARVEPILKALAVEGGYVHAGGPGAGHFVKLVHNGIEFGMLQAIAEGVDLLEHYRDALPVADVLRCWRHGSVIRSWLVDLMAAAYRERGGLDTTPAFVEDTGEVNWLVNDALHMETAIPVIAQSVMQLIASRDGRGNAARAIAQMRHGFGGHPFGADAAIARERRQGRVGLFPRPNGACHARGAE